MVMSLSRESFECMAEGRLRAPAVSVVRLLKVVEDVVYDQFDAFQVRRAQHRQPLQFLADSLGCARLVRGSWRFVCRRLTWPPVRVIEGQDDAGPLAMKPAARALGRCRCSGEVGVHPSLVRSKKRFDKTPT